MKTKKYRKGIIAGALVVILLLLWPDLTNSSKLAMREIVSPVEKIGSNTGRKSASMFSILRGLGGGAEREQHLSLELVKAQSELKRLENIELENFRLREALNLKRVSLYELTPAIVISRNISGWWNTIRIQPGADKDIKIDYAVLSPDGLIGKTYQVNRTSTEVLLLSDPAFRVAAKLSDRGVFGMVRGMGSSINGRPLVRIEFINKDIQIQVGDEVTTSGFQNNNDFFPSDIHIGYINEIYKDESGLYQYAEIIPRATSGLLDYLFIATKGKDGS